MSEKTKDILFFVGIFGTIALFYIGNLVLYASIFYGHRMF